MRLRKSKDFTNELQTSFVADPLHATLRYPEGIDLSSGVAGGSKTQHFEDGPPPGKKWHVYITMSVVETDDE